MNRVQIKRNNLVSSSQNLDLTIQSETEETQMERSKMTSDDDSRALIPGLPNDVGSRILCRVPYSHHTRLKPTCKSWYAFFSSSRTLISLRAHFSYSENLICIFPEDPSITSPYLFDPKNIAWAPLPRMPCNPHVYGLSNFASVSIGPHLYVLGGSLFDTRSFPINRPSPTSSTFRFSFLTFTWSPLSPMISPRGSFACTAIPSLGQIVVAGGGSRHVLFGAAGTRMSSVERYDVGNDRWVPMEGLPRCRAGCVGFVVGEREFWVMGGYGDLRTISRVFPVDEYYKDAVVMDVKKGSDGGGGKWREVGDMWRDEERSRLGKVVVVEDKERDGLPDVFMLDNYEIFRYNMASNFWQRESSVPKKPPSKSSSGFVVLDGELHVMTIHKGGDWVESQRPRQLRRFGLLLVQIYNPRKKTWRSLLTKTPLPYTLDFKTAVMCTIRL